MAESLIDQARSLPIDAETPAEALTPAEEKLLDERAADYRRNPDAARPWAEVVCAGQRK